MRRSVSRVLLAIALASTLVIACSKFTSSSDQGTANDAGSDSATVGDEKASAVDSGNAGNPCEAGANVFCENFDEGSQAALANWGGAGVVSGSSTLAILTDPTPTSKPNVLSVSASTDAGVAPTAYLARAFAASGVVSSISCDLDVRLTAYDNTSPSTVTTIFSLGIASANGALTTAYAQLLLAENTLELAVTGPNDANPRSVSISNVSLGVWNHVHLVVQGGASGSAQIEVTGSSSPNSLSLEVPAEISATQMQLGLNSVFNSTELWLVAFDTLSCTYSP